MEMAFNDCRGGGVHFDLPSQFFETSRPPGWDPTVDDHTEVYYDFVVCERVGVLHFERGPLQILFEHHTDLRYPQDCQAGANRLHGLQRVWVDDPELAAGLARAFGLPTSIATFSFANTTSAGLNQATWSWGPPGMSPSTVSLRYTGDDTDSAGNGPVIRMAYWNWTHLGLLDKVEQNRDPFGTVPLHEAHMQPPTLAGEAGLENAVGLGDIVTSGDLSATVQLFSDPECKVPADPTPPGL
jgi:hypothetical protein